MRLQPYLRILLAGVVVYVGWIFLNRWLADRRWKQHEQTAAVNSEFEKVYGGAEVKILNFYARDGVLTEGGKTVICYGVVNARSVRIEPPLDGVGVTINRCLEAAPEHDTRYTLTAEGNDGRTVSESFLLSVRADADALPEITSFRIAARKKDYLGRTVFLLAYADRNAEEISIDPPVFEPMHRSPNGQFYVAPQQTTTYTLTVKGKHGHVARKQLTVEVP